MSRSGRWSTADGSSTMLANNAFELSAASSGTSSRGCRHRSPPDLYLVTDRVREGWLVDRTLADSDARKVEVQPPIWTGSTTTSEYVVLRGPTDDGHEVEITVEQGSGPSGQAAVASGDPVVDLGRGRVFTTRDGADAAASEVRPPPLT